MKINWGLYQEFPDDDLIDGHWGPFEWLWYASGVSPTIMIYGLENIRLFRETRMMAFTEDLDE